MWRKKQGRKPVYLLPVLLLAGLSRGAEDPDSRLPQAEEVTIEGEEGWKLSALYFAPPGEREKCPAVILTHMLNGKKEDWKPLLPALTAAGFAVVTYDMRGHGGSVDRKGQPGSWKSFEPADWALAQKDLTRIRQWLLSAKKPKIDPRRVALMGGSIGANLSLRTLAADAELRGAVLLSPGLDYRGVKTEESAGRLAAGQKMAVLATKEDSEGYCAKTVEKLAAAAGEEKVLVNKIYPGGQHGTDMFGNVEGIETEVVKALQIITAPEPASGQDVKEALDRVL